ncbi:DUF433 domain-containing protein [Corticibacterium sp. UT-5YL-CI-8]|nr:DUF433 domain-containing protein [Tianweitania sp. UT-5YL-CI-8]
MNFIDANRSLIGTGLYSPAEAARLTKVPTNRIRRWMQGYSRSYQGQQVFDPPLWHSEVPEIDGSLFLGFRDLIELRMIDGFRRQSISLPYIRKVVEAARRLVKDTHPFSTTKFKTDGRKLFLEIVASTEEPQLIEILSGQHTFHSIVSSGLQDIEFEADVASLWRPSEGNREVVIDPLRSFGQPILDRYGVPTAAIERAHRSGRTLQQITDDFEIDSRAFKAALRFEDSLAA